VHFGLGKAAAADISVRCAKSENVTGVAAGHILSLREISRPGLSHPLVNGENLIRRDPVEARVCSRVGRSGQTLGACATINGPRQSIFHLISFSLLSV
jgi:hypothetical protein